MVTETKEMHTCQYCGITDENVLHYYAKVGGSDQPVEQSHCEDIDSCLERSYNVNKKNS